MKTQSADATGGPDATGPVTVIVARRPRPGREADYEAWVDDIVAASTEFPGYVGTSVVHPEPGHREYLTIFRFDTVPHLRAWQASEARRSRMARLDDLVESDASIAKVEGLDVWLGSMVDDAAGAPSRFRSTLLVFVVVYVMILLLSPVGEWALPHAPPKVRLFATVFVQVFAMAYFVMPPLTRWLARWLRPG